MSKYLNVLYLGTVVQCTGGQLYKECMDTCGRTCTDLVHEEECFHTAEEVPCVPGCNCPGKTLILVQLFDDAAKRSNIGRKVSVFFKCMLI